MMVWNAPWTPLAQAETSPCTPSEPGMSKADWTLFWCIIPLGRKYVAHAETQVRCTHSEGQHGMQRQQHGMQWQQHGMQWQQPQKKYVP